MAWIKTRNPRDASSDYTDLLRNLRRTFPPEYGTPVESASGSGESIVDSHSLIPEALHHAFMTMSVLMDDGLPLERRQQEMIATVVSKENDCHY
ncbi:MAG: hypothetical protein HKN33_09700 [Pyrinomonadaceae bacterium]|nr:hypothetical protein [Pyrinomonadaceae bacterium]